MPGLADLMGMISGGAPTGGVSIPENPVATGSGDYDIMAGIANIIGGA